MAKKQAAKGHTAKHTASTKHQRGAKPKHHPAKQKPPAHKAGPAPAHTVQHGAAAKPKKRTLALGEAVACCSAEALAASLRLQGVLVRDEDVLALHWAAGGTRDEGADIRSALEAAQRFGLAGWRPRIIPSAGLAAGMILGADLPGGPHALTLDASGAVWSWGGLYSPGQLQAGPAEEAWAVTWQ